MNGNGENITTESCFDLLGIYHVGVQFMTGTKFPLEGRCRAEREHRRLILPLP